MMHDDWQAGSGLPKAELDAIRAAGGPQQRAEDAHKLLWYKTVARELYPDLTNDDGRDEATFQRELMQTHQSFAASPEWRDFIQNKHLICAQPDAGLRGDYMRAFEAMRAHGPAWVSSYQA